MTRIAVLGAGSWGTTLAHLLACKGDEVRLWAFEPEVAEAINRRHGNLARALCRRRARLGSVHGRRRSCIIEGHHQPLEPVIARQAAGHRLQPKPEARCDGRRAAVAAGPGQQHARRAESAGEIMGGQADPKVEAGQAKLGVYNIVLDSL